MRIARLLLWSILWCLGTALSFAAFAICEACDGIHGLLDRLEPRP